MDGTQKVPRILWASYMYIHILRSKREIYIFIVGDSLRVPTLGHSIHRKSSVSARNLSMMNVSVRKMCFWQWLGQ